MEDKCIKYAKAIRIEVMRSPMRDIYPKPVPASLGSG
jgi:hypothetical protein